MTRLLLIVLISLSSTQLHAGQEVRNGGNVLVCKAGQPKIAMFDLTEDSEHFHNRTQITAKSVDEILKQKLEKLRELDPEFAGRLTPEISAYPAQFEFKPKIDLTTVADSLQHSLPKDCKLVQAAIRKKTIEKGEARFLVSKDLWDQLDLRSKAALIFHELIYQDFIANGADDSRQVRKLNAVIQSDEFLLYQPANYPLLAARWPELHTKFTQNGVSFLSGGTHKLDFDDRGAIIKGTVATSEAKFIVGENHYVFSNPNGELLLELYANGIPVSGWLANPTEIKLSGKVYLIEYLVKFSRDGEITQACLVNHDGEVVGTYPKKP